MFTAITRSVSRSITDCELTHLERNPINLEKAKKIIDTKEPFIVLCDGRLVEIAKFSDRFEQKSILAKPETVLN